MFNLAILDRMEGDLPRAEDWLFRSFAAGHADPEGTLSGWISWYEDHQKPAATARLLERAVRAYPNNEAFSRALGLARYRGGACAACAVRVEDLGSRDPELSGAFPDVPGEPAGGHRPFRAVAGP